MITLTKTINKLPKNPLLKTNKGEHRFEMNIKTRTGNHQQATPRAPPFYHFLGEGGGRGGGGGGEGGRLDVHANQVTTHGAGMGVGGW